MTIANTKQNTKIEIADPQWKDLYTIGGVCGVFMTVLTIIAIGMYFVWPYKPGISSALDIFSTIRNNKFVGLMSLDIFMVIITIITIPFFLALYVALKKVNKSYALIALVFGLISCIVIIPARPIAEMFYLSNQYFAATTDVAKNQYLAAGEALSSLFNGTAWIIYFLTFGVDLIISSFLMLRTKMFSKTTAYMGIFLNIGLLSIFAGIPSFTQIATLLNLVTTIVGAIWNILVARTLFQLAKQVKQ